MGNISSSLDHALRLRQTLNADPKIQNITSPDFSKKNAMEKLKNLLPPGHRKDAVKVIECMITLSPEAYKRLGKAQTLEYLKNSATWLSQKFGDENMIGWTIHQDEKTPHLSAFVVPVETTIKKKTRRTREEIKANLHPQVQVRQLNAKKWIGSREKLRDMQTSFFQDVGEKFDLERGIKGSKAHHTDIKTWYGVQKSREKRLQTLEKAVYTHATVEVEGKTVEASNGLLIGFGNAVKKVWELTRRLHSLENGQNRVNDDYEIER